MKNKKNELSQSFKLNPDNFTYDKKGGENKIKNTKTIQFFGITLALVMVLVSIPMGFAEPLRVQLEQGIESDQLQCNNPEHVLVIRTNENLACVSERTAEKLGWEIIPTNENIVNLYEENLLILEINNENTLQRAPAESDLSSSGEPVVTSASDVNGMVGLSAQLQSISSKVTLDSISTKMVQGYDLFDARTTKSAMASIYFTLIYMPQETNFELISTISDVYTNDGIVVRVTGHEDNGGSDYLINYHLTSNENTSSEKINDLKILLVDNPNTVGILNLALFWDEEIPLQVAVQSLKHSSAELKEIGLTIFSGE